MIIRERKIYTELPVVRLQGCVLFSVSTVTLAISNSLSCTKFCTQLYRTVIYFFKFFCSLFFERCYTERNTKTLRRVK